MNRTFLIFVVAVFTCGTFAQHASEQMKGGHTMFTGSSFKWAPGPKSLPPGAKWVVIDGDPTKAELFTMRIKMPANYTIPPHWHPADEHVTVLSGTLYMAPFDRLDLKRGKGMQAGGFAVMNAGQRHFAFTRSGGAVVQVHGMGPWGITYVNPKDDPRNK